MKNKSSHMIDVVPESKIGSKSLHFSIDWKCLDRLFAFGVRYAHILYNEHRISLFFDSDVARLREKCRNAIIWPHPGLNSTAKLILWPEHAESKGVVTALMVKGRPLCIWGTINSSSEIVTQMTPLNRIRYVGKTGLLYFMQSHLTV
jgi:hypothetical protein